MKRIPRFLLLTLFSLLVLGGTRSLAGPKPPPPPPNGIVNGILVKDVGFIQQLLDDIFGDPKEGNGNSGGWANGNAGGPTAPIDGGISLLLAAGIGLGMKKMADRNSHPARE
jgi:hypothetical protein